MALVKQAYIYVGLGREGDQEGHGLYRRQLPGGSWELKAQGLPDDPDILLCRAQDGVYRTSNQMFAGTRCGQVLGTLDARSHWEDRSLPESVSEINTVVCG
jgi:hypothetical protein